MTQLARGFLTQPLAHRGLHDVRAGRPENSLASAGAAIAAGYGIEVDIQASKDHVPMVFHDYDMKRLAGVSGPIQTCVAAELAGIGLIGNGEPVPTLRALLDLVDGRVPLLIEIKDQDGAMGPNVGALEEAVARELRGYSGPVAVMSFNPHSVAALAKYAPDIARGLVTESWQDGDTDLIPEARRAELRRIADFDRVGACFVSHEADDLASPRIAELKAAGVPILCWTIRSALAERKAREIADNITFETYLPDMPVP